MILGTIAVFVYIGVYSIGSTINSGVGSGTVYNQFAVLKSDYNTLEGQYSGLKTNVDSSGNSDVKTAYINAHFELVKAKAAIDDVDSALASGKSKEEVQNRINSAQTQLNAAKTSLSNVRGMM